MCGGMPFMMASVTKIRRKSCGENCSGLPGGAGEAGRGERVGEQLADALGGDGPVLQRRWAAGTAAASAGSRCVLVTS